MLIFAAALAWLRQLPAWWRIGMGAATVVLLMTTPSFLHASGRAWNHDFPILLTLLAAVGQVALAETGARPRDRCGGRSGGRSLAGVLLGLAASARLTFAVAGAAFVLSIFLVLPVAHTPGLVRRWLIVVPVRSSAHCRRCTCWGGARAVHLWQSDLRPAQHGLLPAGRGGGTAPDAAMTLAGKLVKTVEYVVTQPGNLLLVLLAAFASLAGTWQLRQGARTALPAALDPLFPGRSVCANAHAAAVHLPALSAAGVDLPRRAGV